MNSYYNLYDFMEARAKDIEKIDVERLPNTLPSGLAQSASEFTLKRFNYGKVRAVDIYNKAHDKVQVFRIYAASVCGIGGMLAIAGPTVASSVTGADLLSTLPYVLAAGYGGIAGAGYYIFRYRRTKKKYRAQFDAKTARILENASVDRALSRKAEKIYRQYVSNLNFARGLPYAEGITNAWPVMVNRELNQFKTLLDQPLDKDMPPSQRVAIGRTALNLLGDHSNWNIVRFNAYIRARLFKLERKNPEFEAKNSDFYVLMKTYDQTFWSVQGTRTNLTALGAIGSVAAPVAISYILPGASDFLSRSIADYTWSDAAPLAAGLASLSFAIYNLLKNLHSENIYRAQYSSDSPLQAPGDRAIAKKAKKRLDKNIQKFAQARDLTL